MRIITPHILSFTVVGMLFITQARISVAMRVGNDSQNFEPIHISRFVDHLKIRAIEEPHDARIHYAIGRFYALAYVLETDYVWGWKHPSTSEEDTTPLDFDIIFHEGRKNFALPPSSLESGTLTLGDPPSALPGYYYVEEPYESARERRQKRSSEFLQTTIEYYRRAADLEPRNAIYRFGLAWALKESGELMESARLYVDVLSQILLVCEASDGKSYPERIAMWADFGQEASFFAEEMLREGLWVLRNMDVNWGFPEKLQVEALHSNSQKYLEHMEEMPELISPILVPLCAESNFHSLVSPRTIVEFRADGLTSGSHWSWITPDAGWLVWDPSGDGAIESGRELFGNVTFWVFWRNGYEALSVLDDDHNHWIEGGELEELSIWRDANSNGISEPGEVQRVHEWGIKALATDCIDHEQAAAWSPKGVVLESGEIRPTYDVLLERKD